MTKTLLCAIIIMLACSVVPAQDKGFGIGVIAGDPTGISVKQWLGPVAALDGAAAWSLIEEPGHPILHLHADFLLHAYPFNVTAGKLPLYFGVGGRVRVHDNLEVGARVPVGVAWLMPIFPLDVFFELAPTMNVFPATRFQLNGGIGIRYFFE